MKINALLFTLVALFLLPSCLEDKVEITRQDYTPEELAILQQSLDLPEEMDDYSISLPVHLSSNGMRPAQISDAKATLGRVLFYDKQLSRNNTVSCASCHHQELGFSDDKAFSVGFDGERTHRNSLALGAVANFEASYDDPAGGISAGFFWDERAPTLQHQSLSSLMDPIEMGMSPVLLEQKLAQIPYYAVLAEKAFGTSELQLGHVTEALEEFINSIVSVNSRFDDGMLTNSASPFGDFKNFSPSENLGKTLYQISCATCHGTDVSRLTRRVANNGLDVEYEDQGVGARSGLETEMGVFKVPFLRNIALTAPYMHDGRFQSLEEVVEHYNSGIQLHPNLSPPLVHEGEPRRMNLSPQDKAALVDFLKTLTDETLLQRERFSDPFRQ